MTQAAICAVPNGTTWINVGRTHYDSNTVRLSKRTRFTIVNARTVVFISQITPAAYDDKAEWVALENTLNK